MGAAGVTSDTTASVPSVFSDLGISRIMEIIISKKINEIAGTKYLFRIFGARNSEKDPLLFIQIFLYYIIDKIYHN
jgi:hypothetical protein